MKDRYKHEGRPLNKSIIRDILYDNQPPPLEWLSIEDLTEMTIQYHLDNGGEPPNIISPYLPTREILLELCEEGKAERIKSGKTVCFRSLSESAQDDRLVELIKQEREHLVAQIRPLEKRKARLDALLIELASDKFHKRKT